MKAPTIRRDRLVLRPPTALPRPAGGAETDGGARRLMDESAVSTATPDTGAVPRGGAWRDLGLLALLLALAAGSRLWLLAHTEVAARDSIGYIRYALQFEHEPWREVLKVNLQHPGYPAAVLAVSLPVRQYLAAPEAVVWQLSAQLASA